MASSLVGRATELATTAAFSSAAHPTTQAAAAVVVKSPTSFRTCRTLQTTPATASLKYRGTANWLGVGHLPSTMGGDTAAAGSGGGGRGGAAAAEQTFKQAIHVDKYNKDYTTLFSKLSSLTLETLMKKQFLRVATFTTFDRIVLRSFVHHCQNPRYGYGFNSPRYTSDDGQELVGVVNEALAQEDRANAGDSADPKRVLFDGPTWWQQHKAHNPQLVPAFFAGCG